MTTTEIAARLHELCSQNQYEAAQTELYHPDAESFEPEGAKMAYAKGLEAIKAKGDHFQASVEEIHGGHVGQPIVANNYIAMTISLEATFKGMGRVNMDEIAVYKVADGKIVEERFFY
jgi:hypothetical protein